MRVDGVAGDVARAGVDGEEVPAVVADLHPARRGLEVGVGRGSDRGELTGGAVAVRGHRTAGDAGGAGEVVRVTDEQLRGVGGRELGAELAQALPGEGRALGGGQAAIGQHREAVDLRGAGAGADEVVAGGVEEHVAQAGAIGDGDRRVRDRDQLADGIQPEAGVAAAASAGVRDVDQAGPGDRDAYRRDAAR